MRKYNRNKRQTMHPNYKKSQRREDKNPVLKNFPNIELSYEKIAHKIVQKNSTIFLSIPYGKKYFAWFNDYSGKPKCILMEIDRKKKGVSNIASIRCCFDPRLCQGRGTILYGTKFQLNHKNAGDPTFFNIEDIFYFKGRHCGNQNFSSKIQHCQTLFNNYMKQIVYTDNELILGLPVFGQDTRDIISMTNSLPYRIYAVQSRDIYAKKQTYYNHKIDTFVCPRREAVFEVTADIIDDVYHLHTRDAEYFRVAAIQSYKCSVMMNRLFRNIRENDNLDYLEESDDEEVYQDCDVDKFLNKKRFKMLCEYNKKFKKWIPIRVIERGNESDASQNLMNCGKIEMME